MIEIAKLAENLEAWQTFTATILGVILYFIFKTDIVQKLFQSKEDKEKKMLESEISKVKKELINKTLKNIEGDAHRVLQSLNHCTGVNYYVVHDSGKDLEIADKWFITVLRSTSFEVATDFEKPTRIGRGFKWLNKKATYDKYLYVPDVEKEPMLVGYDLEYLRIQNIKSVVVCLVRSDITRYHMISLNFDKTNPLENNEGLRKKVIDFKRSVLYNI